MFCGQLYVRTRASVPPLSRRRLAAGAAVPLAPPFVPVHVVLVHVWLEIPATKDHANERTNDTRGNESGLKWQATSQPRTAVSCERNTRMRGRKQPIEEPDRPMTTETSNVQRLRRHRESSVDVRSHGNHPGGHQSEALRRLLQFFHRWEGVVELEVCHGHQLVRAQQRALPKHACDMRQSRRRRRQR